MALPTQRKMLRKLKLIQYTYLKITKSQSCKVLPTLHPLVNAGKLSKTFFRNQAKHKENLFTTSDLYTTPAKDEEGESQLGNC
jgi:hypothetical protein